MADPKMMAELFGVEAHTINYHLKEIFKSGEKINYGREKNK